MSSKINLQTCEYACKSSIFQDNQLISIKNGNIYRYQYYNNHNWMKNYENKWAASIVKKNGKVIKNIGYLDGKLYRKYTSYYTYLKKSEVIFIRNAK